MRLLSFSLPHLARSRRRPRPSSSPTCCQRTVILVPDHLSPATPSWYGDLASRLPDVRTHLLDMPNPYESNTKRWEAVWLRVLRDAVSRTSVDLRLVAHGTGADACLRLLEVQPVRAGVVLIAPSGDEYFAAERHARPYHWQRIRQHLRGRLVLATSPAVDEDENRRLVHGLQPVHVCWLSHPLGRLGDGDDAQFVVDFISRAIPLHEDE